MTSKKIKLSKKYKHLLKKTFDIRHHKATIYDEVNTKNFQNWIFSDGLNEDNRDFFCFEGLLTMIP